MGVPYTVCDMGRHSGEVAIGNAFIHPGSKVGCLDVPLVIFKETR